MMACFNLEDIKLNLTDVVDVKYREIKCGEELVTIVFIDNLSDSKLISEFIINPLLDYDKTIENVDILSHEVIRLSPAEIVDDINMALSNILRGNVLIFFTSFNEVLYCDAKGYSKRSIGESNTETVIKGPREGFTENIQVSLSSIRRRLSTPDLKIKMFNVGRKSQTSVALLYIDGITPKELILHIEDKINILNNKDYILYSNNLEEILKCKGTPFDTIGYTEKPDTAAQRLSEGRIIVLFDGSPFAVMAPFFFIENFQSTDDYTLNKYMANIGRLLRVVAFALSTLLPALYLALVTYHFKLIPSIFLFRMAISRAGVPIPTVMELIFMILLFQLIREAAVRLPQPIGSTLSIVGALILGDAAVASGLASQVTVVVVGITSICSYLVPNIYVAIFTWNIILVFFSAFLGLPGFYTGFVLLVAHISNLTSCGYPFLYPLGTRETFKYKDVTFRGDLNKISNEILIKGGK